MHNMHLWMNSMEFILTGYREYAGGAFQDEMKKME